jgi:MoaA/NifB/PqqE/SkfB family radical SAM enzyme
MTELTPRPTAVREDAGGRLPLLPRRDPVLELPLLILYPHSRCNCRCLMCDIWRVTTKEELGVADVTGWLPEWRALGVRRVVLSGGEPLMHSDFWALCAAIRSAGIDITLLSTGLLLRRDPGRVVEYCDDIVVSLDGPREVHNHIRNIPRAYDKLADGVMAVRQAGGEVRISGRCTVQRENFRAMRATVDAADELGLDRISFLAADVSTDAFNRPSGWDAEKVAGVALARDDLPLLRAELDALEREHAADFAAGFIAESPAKLRRRIYQYYAALLGLDGFHPIECNAPWVSAVIETDGTVRPCFFQPPLGNLRDGPGLAAVLNSEEALAWRRGLDMRRNEICRKCVCSLALRQAGHGLDHS